MQQLRIETSIVSREVTERVNPLRNSQDQLNQRQYIKEKLTQISGVLRKYNETRFLHVRHFFVHHFYRFV